MGKSVRVKKKTATVKKLADATKKPDTMRKSGVVEDVARKSKISGGAKAYGAVAAVKTGGTGKTTKVTRADVVKVKSTSAANKNGGEIKTNSTAKASGVAKKTAKKIAVREPVKFRMIEAGTEDTRTQATKIEVDDTDDAGEDIRDLETPAIKALPMGEIAAKPARKSMSGMVVEKVGRTEEKESETEETDTESKATDGPVVEIDGASEEAGEPRFSQLKSALIGIGVAVAVAVVGFVGIGIFSGDQRKCTVQFDSNGGSAVDGTEIICGRAVREPDQPTKEGFTFNGWALEGTPFDFNKMTVYKNSVLVALWAVDDGTETVTVHFDTAGGTEMQDILLAKGKKLPEPTRKPTRSGYAFVGWYLGNKAYDFSKPVNEDITLTAKWAKVQTPATNQSSNNNNGNNGQSGNNNGQTGNNPPSTLPEEPEDPDDGGDEEEDPGEEDPGNGGDDEPDGPGEDSGDGGDEEDPDNPGGDEPKEPEEPEEPTEPGGSGEEPGDGGN